jgi:hypothetical protein
MDPIIIASLIAAVATILGAIISAFASLQKPKMLKIKEQKSFDTAEQALLYRIADAKKNLRSYAFNQTSYRWSNFLLTFGQYVVGGILATSLIYESLPREIIGSLGVLVMVASFIRNRERPDIKIHLIKEKSAIRLRGAIREAEDNLSMARFSPDSPEQLLKAMKELTFALNAIETEELYEIIESKK